MKSENKAKRGKAFDKVVRNTEVRQKYMFVGLGKIDECVIKDLGMCSMAAEFIKSSTDDGGFTLVGGFSNDDTSAPDVALIPEERVDMLNMLSAVMVKRFSSGSGSLKLAVCLPDELVESVKEAVVKAVHGTTSSLTIH